MSSDLANAPVVIGHEYYPLRYTHIEFRVLNFLGDRNTLQDQNSLLKFNFQTLSLRDELVPRYHAISYTWDANPGTATILLDDKEVTVPGSAERALRGVISHMVPDLSESSICLLWIDAVCIDQGNLEEKSKQVAMMREIYARGAEVFVWLGEDDDGMARAAFETVEMLAGDCVDKGADESELHLPAWAWKDKFPYWSEDPPLRCDWRALGRLLEARWFARLWIIQEVVVAGDVTMIWGRSSIPWETLAKAVRWTWHRTFTRNITEALGDENKKDVPMNLLFAREICRLRDTPSSQITLSQLLLCNCHLEASNPWDRVFGLLGLLRDEDAPQLVTDYERRLRDVYAEATYAAMVEQGTLYLLGLAIDNKSSLATEDDWPSWVPRYQQLKGHREIASFSRTNGCRASDGVSMTCRYSSEGNVLDVKGVSVGRVACVLDISSLGDMSEDDDNNEDSESDDEEEEEKAVYQRLAQAWFSGSSATTSVSMTNIASSLHQQKDSSPKLWRKALQIKDLASFFLNVVRQSPRTCEAEIERLLCLADGDEGDSWSIVCSLQNFVRALGLSSIALLEDGRFGFCVGTVEVGDEICLLFGGDLLFVLRAGEMGCRRMCAYAVVSGVMEGEHIRQLRDQGRLEAETRTFHIV